jgi:ferrous iron transport protein B
VDAKYKGQSGPEIEGHIQAEKLENSYAGLLGHAIEPAIRPLGYDWKIGIGLVTSFAAREVFVGTMSTIYGLRGDADDFSSLKENMLKDKDPDTGRPIYTIATVGSLLVFYVFAMLCMSTLATTFKETRSLKWTLVQLFFMTGLAYLGAFVTYNLLG